MPPKRTSTRKTKVTAASKSKDKEPKSEDTALEADAPSTEASQDVAPSEDPAAEAPADAVMEEAAEAAAEAPTAAEEATAAVPAEDAPIDQAPAAEESVAAEAPAAAEEPETSGEQTSEAAAVAKAAKPSAVAPPAEDAAMEVEEPVVQLDAASPEASTSHPVAAAAESPPREERKSRLASRLVNNALADADVAPAKQEPSSGPSRTATGRRRLALDPHMARRGGLLGVLNSTLGKVLNDNKKMESSEAAKRRAEVEARARQKIARDNEVSAEVQQQRQLRNDERAAQRLTEQIVSGDAEHRATRASKRRLASFLVTPSEMALEAGRLHKIIAPRVPAAIAPLPAQAPPNTRAPDAHPLYFLPKKLTNAQEDLLDDQEDEVDDDIAKADEVWAEAREKLVSQLEVVKKRMEEVKSKKEGKTVDGDAEMKAAEAVPKKEVTGDKDEEMDEAAQKRQDALEAPPLPNTVST